MVGKLILNCYDFDIMTKIDIIIHTRFLEKVIQLNFDIVYLCREGNLLYNIINRI